MTHGMVVSSKELKERSLYVYLPSRKMAEEWKERASKQDQSISKFIIEHVLDSIRQVDREKSSEGEERGPAASSKVELIRNLREKDEELKRVNQEAKLYRQLAEKLDSELRHYRIQPFLDPKFKGVSAYDKNLIELLKKRRQVDSDRLLDALNIDPTKTELVKGIRNQLDLLEAYGLVETTPRGWKWVG